LDSRRLALERVARKGEAHGWAEQSHSLRAPLRGGLPVPQIVGRKSPPSTWFAISHTKGLSFADSVQTLAAKALEGQVWIIPRGSRIPKGLVFNVKDYDHPLLNVSEPMSVLQLTALLTELASMMKPCDVKIDRFGKIIESYPGALKKVASA
jgi:hypothetical protein